MRDKSPETLRVQHHKSRDRHAEALERKEYRDGLTDLQQSGRLNTRLGKGHGATKERTRLMF